MGNLPARRANDSNLKTAFILRARKRHCDMVTGPVVAVCRKNIRIGTKNETYSFEKPQAHHRRSFSKLSLIAFVYVSTYIPQTKLLTRSLPKPRFLCDRE